MEAFGQQFVEWISSPFAGMSALIIGLLVLTFGELGRRIAKYIVDHFDPRIKDAVDIGARYFLAIAIVLVAIVTAAQLRVNPWAGFGLGFVLAALGAQVYLIVRKRWPDFPINFPITLALGFMIGALVAIPVSDLLRYPLPRSIFIARADVNVPGPDLDSTRKKVAEWLTVPLTDALEGSAPFNVRPDPQRGDYVGYSGSGPDQFKYARSLDREYDPVYLAASTLTKGGDWFTLNGRLLQYKGNSVDPHEEPTVYQAWPAGLESVASAAMGFRLAYFVLTKTNKGEIADVAKLESQIAQTYCERFIRAAEASQGLDLLKLQELAGEKGAKCKAMQDVESLIADAMAQVKPALKQMGNDRQLGYETMIAYWCRFLVNGQC